MYKTLITILLVAGCAGCAHHSTKKNPTVALAPMENQVEEVSDPSVASASLAAVLPQFSRGPSPAMISLQSIYSIEKGLPNVQKLTKRPVVAMTQYRNFYWYATDVSRNPDTQAIQSFLSGYAVQRGGYLAWKW